MWGAHVVFFALAVEVFVLVSIPSNWPRTAAENKTNCLVCLKQVRPYLTFANVKYSK